ncbi:MAG: phage baseplate assembly protein V [Salinisphaera sp.]|nr:phage baseplate assembly protein V [Salinisphaera sp.]
MSGHHAFARLMAPVSRRVRGMIARCLLDSVDATTLRQIVQVKLLDGELAAGVELFEPYGFSGVPLDGDGLFLAIGGNRGHGAAFNVGGKTHRPTDLAAGEACVYNQLGDRITIRQTGVIEVTASTKVLFDTPLAEFTADVLIRGNEAIVGDSTGQGEVSDHLGSMDEIRGVYNGHNHSDPQGGTVGPPNQEMT